MATTHLETTDANAVERASGGVQPRRVPQQARSNRRVEQILLAAADVFATVGYEAATTNAIAARAHVPIGSVYQFFPNKEAILSALAQQYLDQLRAVYNRVTPDALIHLSVAEQIDRVIDPLAELITSQPGFRPVLLAAQLSPQIAAATEALQEDIRQRIERGIAVRAPALDATSRRLYAMVTAETAKALLLLARSTDTQMRAGIIAEMKRLLLMYFQSLGTRQSLAPYGM